VDNVLSQMLNKNDRV